MSWNPKRAPTFIFTKKNILKPKMKETSKIFNYWMLSHDTDRSMNPVGARKMM